MNFKYGLSDVFKPYEKEDIHECFIKLIPVGFSRSSSLFHNCSISALNSSRSVGLSSSFWLAACACLWDFCGVYLNLHYLFEVLGLPPSFQYICLWCIWGFYKSTTKIVHIFDIRTWIFNLAKFFYLLAWLEPLKISAKLSVEWTSKMTCLMLSSTDTIAMDSCSDDISSFSEFGSLLDQTLSWVVLKSDRYNLYPQIAWGELHSCCDPLWGCGTGSIPATNFLTC